MKNKQQTKRTAFAQNLVYRKQLRELQKDNSKTLCVSKIRKSQRESDIRKTLQGSFIINEIEETEKNTIDSQSPKLPVETYTAVNDNKSSFKQLPMIEKRKIYLQEKRDSKSSMEKKFTGPDQLDGAFSNNQSGDHIASIKISKPEHLASKSKTMGDALNKNVKVQFQELNNMKSTDASDGMTQKQVEFIPNLELERRFRRQQQNKAIASSLAGQRHFHREKFNHSKSQMTPVKVSGISIEPTSIKKTSAVIPPISITRNEIGFKSVETRTKPHIQSYTNALCRKKGSCNGYGKEILISQRDMDVIRSHERVPEFRDFCIYGTSNQVNLLDKTRKKIKDQGFTTPKIVSTKPIKHAVKHNPCLSSSGMMLQEPMLSPEISKHHIIGINMGMNQTPINLSMKKNKAIIVKSPHCFSYKGSSHQIQALHFGDDIS